MAKPWSVIPRQHKPLIQKIHIILLGIFAVAFLGFIGLDYYTNHSKNIGGKNDYSIAVLLDTSLSMSAKDILPNRFNHTIAITTGLIQEFPASYTTIFYSAIPTVRTPLSIDGVGIANVISQFSLGSNYTDKNYMGSSPGSAIGLALTQLSSTTSKHKAIIVFSDGNENTGFAMDDTVQLLQNHNTELYLCLVGTTGNIIGVDRANQPMNNGVSTTLFKQLAEKYEITWLPCNDTKNTIESLTALLREQVSTTKSSTDSVISLISEIVFHPWFMHILLIGIGYYILILLYVLIFHEMQYNRKKDF